MKIVKKCIYLVFLFVLFSCNKKMENTQPMKKSVDVENNISVPKQNNQSITELPKQTEKTAPDIQSKKSIPAEKLLQFLPDNIRGMKKEPSGKGVQNWKGQDITVANAQFTYDGGGTLFYLTDYGNKKNIPSYETDEFNRQNFDSKNGVYQISIANGKAFMTWSEQSRTGVFYALICDRFIVKIDATSLPKGSIGLNDLYSLMKIEKLIKLAETLKN